MYTFFQLFIALPLCTWGLYDSISRAKAANGVKRWASLGMAILFLFVVVNAVLVGIDLAL
jgi:hypothetical protein